MKASISNTALLVTIINTIPYPNPSLKILKIQCVPVIHLILGTDRLLIALCSIRETVSLVLSNTKDDDDDDDDDDDITF